MQRQNLSDGRWFDIERAQCWEEDRNWDGSNMISAATGSQWDHEELYRSASGTWILHSWSQYQGSWPSWDPIGEDQAHRWLLANGYSEDLPDSFLASTEA